jgi:hypothetical protein
MRTCTRPNAATDLEILLIPGTGEQPIEPSNQLHLELTDPRLAADQRFARLLVTENPIVMRIRDAAECRNGQRMKCA